MNVTVAICAYNATTRIGMVLESLAKQQVAADIRWEVLVVDNASTDGTGRLAEEMGARLGLPLRVVVEREAGLSNARRCAAEQAQAELICFLDDDVVAPPNWIATCWAWFETHPECGVLGGKVVPLFENPDARPADFDTRYAGVLSMQDLGSEQKRLDVLKGVMVVGAGMAGRRSLFRAAFGELRSITVGRKGTSLAGGEDFEAQLVAERLGWEVWYSPELVLEHWVPTRKLNWGYLEKWYVDTAACHAWLDCLRSNRNAPSRWASGWIWLKSMGLVLRMLAAALKPAKSHTPHSRFLWVKQQWSRQKGFYRLLANHREVIEYFSVLRRLVSRGREVDGAHPPSPRQEVGAA